MARENSIAPNPDERPEAGHEPHGGATHHVELSATAGSAARLRKTPRKQQQVLAATAALRAAPIVIPKWLAERGLGARGSIDPAEYKLALHRALEQFKGRGGRRRRKDDLSHPWRLFADQAIEMQRSDPFLTLDIIVERLGITAEDGRDRTRSLRRWIDDRKAELGGN
jgi:hypothetical protein